MLKVTFIPHDGKFYFNLTDLQDNTVILQSQKGAAARAGAAAELLTIADWTRKKPQAFKILEVDFTKILYFDVVPCGIALDRIDRVVHTLSEGVTPHLPVGTETLGQIAHPRQAEQ